MNELGIAFAPVLQALEILQDLLIAGAVLVILWEIIVLVACLFALRSYRSSQLRERRSGHA